MPSVRRFGNITLVLLALVPLFFWATRIPLSDRFTSWTTGLASFGQIFGLVGTALFSLNLVMGARFGFLERFFGGLDKMYRSHALFAKIGFGLLLAHPLLLAPMYSAGMWAGVKAFLLPGYSTAVTYGWFALVLMTVLIALTLWIRPPYHIWKFTHKFLGGAFFLGALHVYLIPSDTAQSMGLRFYMLGLAGFGLVAFVYRSILGRWLVPQVRYKVKSVRALNAQVVQVEMEALGQPLLFRAGQFVFVRFLGGSVSGEVHPFSISSSPCNPLLVLRIKNSGDYTQRMAALKPGAEARIEGPYGMFSYRNAVSKNQVWIAGGIGITPFLAMAEDLKPDEGNRVSLYYCVREEVECVGKDILDAAVVRMKGAFEWRPFYSSTQGRMSAGILQNDLGNLQGKDYFLCAPPLMIAALRAQLIDMGVPPSAIHSEEFGY